MATTRHKRNRAWQLDPPGCLLMLRNVLCPGPRPGPQGLLCFQRHLTKPSLGFSPSAHSMLWLGP